MTTENVHPDVDELVALIGADLRAARDASPLPILGADLAAVFADGLPAAAPLRTTSRRRRAARRAVVGAAVLGFATGGLGVAGALPGPVQRAVADVADVVGVDLPEAQDTPAPTVTVPPADDAPTTTARPSTTTSVPRPERPATTAPPVVDDEVDDGDSRGRGRGRGRGQGTATTEPAVETDAEAGKPATPPTTVPKSKDGREDVEDEVEVEDDVQAESADDEPGRSEDRGQVGKERKTGDLEEQLDDLDEISLRP